MRYPQGSAVNWRSVISVRISDLRNTPISITILFAHALLWVATFMRRNIAQGHAVVVKLAVSESALALALIFGACVDGNSLLRFWLYISDIRYNLAALCAIVPYTALKHRVCPFFVIPCVFLGFKNRNSVQAN